MTQNQWRNRIVGSGVENPEQLLANPFNMRIHPKAQQDALAGVLDTVGLVDRVMVNQRTGHVVDGHLRVALAISAGQREIPVDYVDLTEEEERIVLASHDWIAQMAVYDAEQVDALVKQIESDDARVQQMLDELLAEHTLAFQSKEWRERVLGDKRQTIKVVLYMEQLDLFERALEKTGLNNRGEALAVICRHYLDEAG